MYFDPSEKESSMSVRLLGPDISSHVRSGHTVDSLAQCVVELVQNSLDASASSVVIRVDTRSWRIQVHVRAGCTSYIILLWVAASVKRFFYNYCF